MDISCLVYLTAHSEETTVWASSLREGFLPRDCYWPHCEVQWSVVRQAHIRAPAPSNSMALKNVHYNAYLRPSHLYIHGLRMVRMWEGH